MSNLEKHIRKAGFLIEESENTQEICQIEIIKDKQFDFEAAKKRRSQRMLLGLSQEEIDQMIKE
jgi:hypothetical protein